MYVIMRNDGKYVSRAGAEHSYCHSLNNARIYRERLTAVSHLCPENESVVSVDSILNAGRN